MAGRLTFRGGIHVEEHKNTRKSQIQTMPAPAVIYVPMSQHIGAPCTPIVKVGDVIDRGQRIGEVTVGLGCPVHSGVSGKVKAIVDKYNSMGVKNKYVVIENDFENRLSPSITPFSKRLVDTTTEEIVNIVRDAGISGMGGATFPTHAKITSAMGKVDTLIINCAECEPFITANHRLLLEHPERVINGTKILLKAFGLREGFIAVEDNKLDAVNKLEQLLEGSELIKVKVLKTKYPQGDERQLIYAISGKELPTGKLPADVGAVIFNAETTAAIFKAFADGMPLVERTVTVDGDCIKNPKNLLITIGTPIRDVINFCGGLRRRPYKVISGGPMMGAAQWDIDSPVIKSTSALLVFSSSYGKMYDRTSQCIRCGRCAEHCPMHLMPLYLAAFSKAGEYDKCEQFDVMSCVECGSCAYNCPGNVPIVQRIRAAKGVVGDRIKAQKAAEAAKAAQAAKSTEAAKPTDTVKSAEVAKPTEAAKTEEKTSAKEAQTEKDKKTESEAKDSAGK